MLIDNNPISHVQWIDISLLSANDYNPNVVFTDEMKLLLFSIRKSGWIQPILITQDYVIIDGFHRATLARSYDDITVDGRVPCVVMNLTEPERMMLTIRINRAKGSHIALKMHDIMHRLIDDYGVPIRKVCEGIGARRQEVELLLMDNVFMKKGINEETEYSKAWVPNLEERAKQSVTKNR